jgi:glycosyltransferase involved in cell wall biosynthesis
MMVSVVIPTYNHCEHVLATIESVFAQTFRDLEVIVVNDGSPDDTAQILAPLAAAGRIRYIEQPNQGQAAARNQGLAEASGRYIAFLDDDDLWPAEKLAWQVEGLERDAQTVLVYGTFALMTASGELQPPEQRECPSGDVHEAFRRQCWIMSLGQTLIRVSSLRAVGGFDEQVWGSDDWEMYIRLAKQGGFRYEPRTALHYRQHESNASRQALRHTRGHFKVVFRHIGWNLPLLLRHQAAAGRYFLPKLLSFADEARRDGEYGLALRALGYALAFHPALIVQRRWLMRALRTILRRPIQPQQSGITPVASETRG